MWLQRGKLAQAVKTNNLKLVWIARRLGCSLSKLSRIVNGEQAANYRIARELLEVFGYDTVVQSIDWGRTSYAG